MTDLFGKKLVRLLMLAGSSVALAQGAFAQAEGASNAGTPVAPDSARPTAPLPGEPAQTGTAATADAGLGDIVVTAQRFTETVQRTALVLSVINTEQLKGVSDIRGLSSIDPGVQLGGSGGLTQTFIRGVGSAVAIAGQESAIAYNVDSVFLYTPSMVTPLMYDIDRVEVLKGPQGTLYGRNASGGAINVITAGARLGKVEGYVEGEIGNYDRRRATGAINLPIGDTLAVRFAGQHIEHDGYLSDGTEDQDMTSGRIRVRWEPSSAVTLQLGGDVSHQGGRGPGSSIDIDPNAPVVLSGPLTKFIGTLDPAINTIPITAGGTQIFATPPYATPFLDNDQWSINAQLDVDLGFATLTVLPAYRRENSRYQDYVPGFGDGQNNKTRQKTLETRLANRTDTLKWVLGAFYIKTKQGTASRVRQDAPPFFSDQDAVQNLDLESYAFFGEATLSVTDSFRVTGGLRYTNEKTDLNGFANSRLTNPVFNPAIDPADFSYASGTSANALSWKAGVEYDLAPDSLLFATASRGFKGGGTYANDPGLPNSFDPEYLTAFELGSRNRFLDNTLQVNGGLFYWKLKDQQVVFLALNGFGRPILQQVNAGKAHMYGANIDVVFKLSPNDTLRGAAEYTKSEYDSFVRNQPFFTVLEPSACSIGPIQPSGNRSVDCSGLPVLRAPKWVATAGYDHRFDLASGDTLTFATDMTYGSGRYLTLNYTPLSYQKGYTLFNASLTYEMEDPNVTLSAWVRNIGDKRVKVNADQFVPQYTRPVLMAPRTVGVSIRYGF